MTIRVWIAGSHTLYNQAFEALLTNLPGIEVIGMSEGLANFPEQWNANDLDLILLLLSHQVDPGLITILRQQHPDLKVLLHSLDWSPPQAQAALQAGAAGCLSADISTAELGNSLRQAARGEIVLSSDLARDLIMSLASARVKSLSTSVSYERLTPREQEVLKLLCEGLSNKQIAQQLYLSVRTIENHLGSIYSKLGVRTRTEAAVLALQHGWVEIG